VSDGAPAGLRLVHRGKVRDTYELDVDRLLMVASDRISAFDWVLPTLIPSKGVVLANLSRYWFELLRDVAPNHYVREEESLLSRFDLHDDELKDRAMVVRRAERIDYECVVRGYLSGSGWAEYRAEGTLAGERLPKGLVEGAKLDEARFTPATKNESGHDQNISRETLCNEAGSDLANVLRDTSLALYHAGAAHVASRGLILADTKFEFGRVDGVLTLIDEALTPDSSRYWFLDQYAPGGPQASLDKQPVRDWLVESGWDRESPPPELPPEVVRATTNRYLAAYNIITGKELRI